MKSQVSRSWLGGLGAVGVAAILGLIAGPLGFVAGGILLLCWLVVPTVFVFALGQLLVVAVLTEPSLETIALVEAGFVLILLDSVPRVWRRHVGMITIGGAVGLSWMALGIERQTDALWPAALVLVGAVALSSYMIHRYELVRLNLVEVDG